MVQVEPEAAEHLVLLAYDDDGLAVGEAQTVYDVPLPVTVQPSPFVLNRSVSISVIRHVSKAQRHYAPGYVGPLRLPERA